MIFYDDGTFKDISNKKPIEDAHRAIIYCKIHIYSDIVIPSCTILTNVSLLSKSDSFLLPVLVVILVLQFYRRHTACILYT